MITLRRLFAALVLFALVGTAATAQAATEALLFVEGKQVATDVAPMVEGERLLLPLRAVVEAAGGTVMWDQASATVTARYKGSELVATIGNSVVTLNGLVFNLPARVTIHQGRTMLPVSVLMRFMGVGVNQGDQRIDIQTAIDPVLTLALTDHSGHAVQVRVTLSGLDRPDSCSGRTVAQAVLTVAKLFNAGDEAAFANQFSADFRWFSVHEIGSQGEQHVSLTTKDQLLAHVKSRRRAQEQMLFDAIEVKGAGTGGTGVVFQLRRQALDRVDSGRAVIGKAVYQCDTRQFFVWSMDDEK